MAGGDPRVLPIFREEAERNGLTLEQLLKKRERARFYVRIRQYAMWRARKETGRTLTEIARVAGMDHTTVMHGIAVVEALPPEQRGVVEKPKSMKPKPPTETYIGKPCRNGHVGLRYISNNACLECNSIRRRALYQRQKISAAE